MYRKGYHCNKSPIVAILHSFNNRAALRGNKPGICVMDVSSVDTLQKKCILSSHAIRDYEHDDIYLYHFKIIYLPKSISIFNNF